MKKSEATYAVEFVGNRVVDEFRKARIISRIYAVTKTLDGQTTGYEVTISDFGDWCDCPARRLCKHIQMVYDFRATETG